MWQNKAELLTQHSIYISSSEVLRGRSLLPLLAGSGHLEEKTKGGIAVFYLCSNKSQQWSSQRPCNNRENTPTIR